MLGYKKSSFYLLRPIFCDIFVCKNAWKTRKYHRETLEVRSAIMPARVQYLSDVRMAAMVWYLLVLQCAEMYASKMEITSA